MGYISNVKTHVLASISVCVAILSLMFTLDQMGCSYVSNVKHEAQLERIEQKIDILRKEVNESD